MLNKVFIRLAKFVIYYVLCSTPSLNLGFIQTVKTLISVRFLRSVETAISIRSSSCILAKQILQRCLSWKPNRQVCLSFHLHFVLRLRLFNLG